MTITLDSAELIAIGALLSAVWFVIGLFVAQLTHDAQRSAHAALIAQVRATVIETIRDSLPTEAKFRETVESLVMGAQSSRSGVILEADRNRQSPRVRA